MLGYCKRYWGVLHLFNTLRWCIVFWYINKITLYYICLSCMKIIPHIFFSTCIKTNIILLHKYSVINISEVFMCFIFLIVSTHVSLSVWPLNSNLAILSTTLVQVTRKVIFKNRLSFIYSLLDFYWLWAWVLIEHPWHSVEIKQNVTFCFTKYRSYFQLP